MIEKGNAKDAELNANINRSIVNRDLNESISSELTDQSRAQPLNKYDSYSLSTNIPAKIFRKVDFFLRRYFENFFKTNLKLEGKNSFLKIFAGMFLSMSHFNNKES